MGIEERVLDLIKAPILALGYSDVAVSYKKEMGTFYLRVMIDKEEVISLEEIITVNDLISPMLDKADLIQNEYVLDVTSFGAEKPIKLGELEKYVGKYVHFHLSHPIKGENILEGDLDEVNSDIVKLSFRVKTRLVRVEIPRKDIDDARLAIKF